MVPGGSSATPRAAPGIGKVVTPHTLRHALITAALDAGVPLRDMQEAASHADPRTTMRSRPQQPGPTRHLYRRRLRRGRRPVTRERWELFCLAATVARQKLTAAIGHRPQPQPSANRRYAWMGT